MAISNFSKYLENYMKEKKITSAELARETNIERTVMYRYIKGSRIPSGEETVVKIADALRMTAGEKQKLVEEYDRLSIGDLAVNSYQYVKQLLADLCHIDPGRERDNTAWDVPQKTWQMNQRVISLRTKEEISIGIIKIFESIAEQKRDDITLYLLMQPVYEMIQNLLLPFFEGTQVKIEQIVCLEQNLSKSYENLKIFRNILPLCFASLQYEITYYYDYLSQHINDMSWMPNVMIVEDYVLQFDYGMTQGIMVKDAAYAAGISDQYQERKKQTEPFLTKDRQSLGSDFFNKAYTATYGNCLFAEPCIGLCISSDIFREYLHPFPEKEALIQNIAAMQGDWEGCRYHPAEGRQLSKTTCYCQKSGLYRFLETGYVNEFPAAYYRPLGRDTRVCILERMIYLAKNDYISYQFLPEDIKLPENIYIYWDDETKNLRMNQIQADGMPQVLVKESGICRTFQCFLDYLDKKGMLLGKEDTLAELEEVYAEVHGKTEQGE